MNSIVPHCDSGSFFAGERLKEQEHLNGRIQRYGTLISLAVDKIDKEDLSNQDVMKALISNVYAAYQFCDNPNLAV